jgi:hypothetical protein
MVSGRCNEPALELARHLVHRAPAAAPAADLPRPLLAADGDRFDDPEPPHHEDECQHQRDFEDEQDERQEHDDHQADNDRQDDPNCDPGETFAREVEEKRWIERVCTVSDLSQARSAMLHRGGAGSTPAGGSYLSRRNTAVRALSRDCPWTAPDRTARTP